jgi:RraA family protein
MTIGLRILRRRRKIGDSTIAAFQKLPVANVSDVMSRMSAGGARLRPMHSGKPMVGPAFTVKTRPGDNLMVHKALDIAEPGDIIVVDGGGDLTNALIGEIMLAQAVRRGLGGIVINGAIRDSAAIRKQNFPVFAAGVTHRGPYKDGPGEINVPIAIDGMVIEPGDLVIGDDDGILCVPFDHAEAIARTTQAKQNAEVKTMEEIAAGTHDRSWVDATLKRLNCEIES